MQLIQRSFLLCALGALCVMPPGVVVGTNGATIFGDYTVPGTNIQGVGVAPAGNTNVPVIQITNPNVGPATNALSFFQTAANWMTALNPANAYTTNDTKEIYTAAGFRKGLAVGDYTGIELRPISAAPWLEIGSETGFAGINGVISSQELTLGYACIDVDFKVKPYLGAGYDFTPRSTDPNGEAPYLTVGVELQKKLSANTFALIGMSGQFLGRHGQGVLFKVGTGFTF